MRRTAVLLGVLQAFLKHPKETERDLLGQVLRNAFATKINLYSLALGELPAESLRGCGEAQVVQFRRMQTMRKSLNVVPEIFDLFPDLANGPARLGRIRG